MLAQTGSLLTRQQVEEGGHGLEENDESDRKRFAADQLRTLPHGDYGAMVL
jgi:hypothetical protein